MKTDLQKYCHSILVLGTVLNMTSTQGAALYMPSLALPEPQVWEIVKEQPISVRHSNIPFYSQFEDIHLKEWQKLGCGIAALAMIIEFHNPDSVSVMQLLKEGLAAGAFQKGVGWKHQGLANLAGRYGLIGKAYDLSKLDQQAAFTQFLESLKNGPVLISIHHKFDPKRTLGHLVVATGFENDTIFYHDPEGPKIEKIISTKDFLKGWKKRFIALF